jgi:hypothetical protein
MRGATIKYMGLSDGTAQVNDVANNKQSLNIMMCVVFYRHFLNLELGHTKSNYRGCIYSIHCNYNNWCTRTSILRYKVMCTQISVTSSKCGQALVPHTCIYLPGRHQAFRLIFYLFAQLDTGGPISHWATLFEIFETEFAFCFII